MSRRNVPYRLLCVILLTALMLVIAATFGFYTVFSRSLSLDEGYLMITVQSFLQGEALYDSVFTQYGPVYYFYKWMIHRLFSIPLTHDATRLLCIFHWLGASAVLAMAGRSMTQSLVASLFVFAQAVVHLAPLANEPGHPQELIAMLLGTAVLLATHDASKPLTLPLLAVLGAALLFIKINVGIFFGIALFLALRWHGRDRLARGAWAWLLIAGSSVLPFVLMRHHIMYDVYRNYSLLIAATALGASLTALYITPKSVAGIRPYLVSAAAFLSAAACFITVIFFLGTSLSGMIHGLLFTALKTPAVGIFPFSIPNAALLSAAASLIFAVFAALHPNHPRLQIVVTSLKGTFGVIGSIAFVGDGYSQLKYLLPWVWLVLIRLEGRNLQSPTFARVLLCLMSVWQALQGYPIAGTQVAIASLLLVLTCTVCLVDALDAIGLRERIDNVIGTRRRGRLLLQTAGGVLAIYVFASVWCRLPERRQYYSNLPPLDLPGSQYVRTDPETTRRYQALARYLQEHSDTFLTCPGMNSFYFWTEKPPPTHLNATALGLLSGSQEKQVLAALRGAKRPLVVLLEDLVTNQNNSAPTGLLLQGVRDEYVEVHRIPPFRIYTPRKPGI